MGGQNEKSRDEWGNVKMQIKCVCVCVCGGGGGFRSGRVRMDVNEELKLL